ncbi:MAG: hypothetical protein MUP66_04015 [Candidatus Nanohaloarchaeota archaeon QJJ-5]|nr:hypothetical protein [Candidatus Nanohaloarchaeota archaeon QJJ-5]
MSGYDAVGQHDQGAMPDELHLLQLPVDPFMDYEDSEDVLETQIEKAASYADHFSTMAEIFERAEAEYRNLHSTASYLANEDPEDEQFYREEIEESLQSFAQFEDQLRDEMDEVLETTAASEYDDAIDEATLTLAGTQMATIPNGVHREYDIDPEPGAVADLRAYSHTDVKTNPTRDPVSLFVKTVQAGEENLALELNETHGYGLMKTMLEEESLLEAFVERDQELIDRGQTAIAQDEGLYIQALTRAEERGSTVKQEMTNLLTGHEESNDLMYG